MPEPRMRGRKAVEDFDQEWIVIFGVSVLIVLGVAGYLIFKGV